MKEILIEHYIQAFSNEYLVVTFAQLHAKSMTVNGIKRDAAFEVHALCI